MPKHVLRPDGLRGTDVGVVGAASTTAATVDNSDSSYVQFGVDTSTRQALMWSYTKVAGSMIRYVQPVVRVAAVSGSCRIEWWAALNGGYPTARTSGYQFNGTVPTWLVGPASTAYGDMVQASIDQLEVHYRCVAPSASQARFYEIVLDVYTALQPTCAVSSPTGTINTSSVTGSWTHTPGTDGGGQVWYRAKLFDSAQYGTQGFNPQTSQAVWDSGAVASSATSVTMTGLVGGVYRLYVMTAQSVNGNQHWAPWAFSAFTVSLTTAEVSTVVPTVDSPNGRVALVVNRDTAKDAWSSVEVQRLDGVDQLAEIADFKTGSDGMGTGWTMSGTGTSPTSLLQAASGGNFYQRFGATLNVGQFWTLYPLPPLDRIAVDSGDVAELGADVSSFTFPAGIEARLIFAWFDIAGNDFAYSVMPVAVTSTIGRRIYAMTAPAGAVAFRPQIEIANTAGAAGAVVRLNVDAVRVYINAEWVDVRGAASLTPSTNTLTVYDYEAPPGIAIRYRARAVKAAGPVVGSWIDQFETTTPTVDGVWFKSITNPVRNVKLDWAQLPDPSQDIAQGSWVPLGSEHAVVVSDVRQSRQGDWLIRTYTDAETAKLRALLSENDVILVQAPADYRFPAGYFSVGQLQKQPWVQVPDEASNWRVAYREVARP